MPSPSAKRTDKKADTPLSRLAGRTQQLVAASPVASSLALSIIAGVAFIALCGLFAWHHYVVQERDRQVQVFAEQNARAAASDLGSYLQSVNDRLNYFTGSRSLHTALQYEDPVGRAEMHQAVANSFPSGENTRNSVGSARR